MVLCDRLEQQGSTRRRHRRHRRVDLLMYSQTHDTATKAT